MPRWEILVVAAATAGCVMLIENGHRIDTGASDEEVVASAPADCTVVYAVNRESMGAADDNAPREEAALAAAPECTDR